MFSVSTNPKRPDISDVETTEELVDILIAASDPDGPNIVFLREIKMWIEERVMLSESDECFLDDLVDRINGPKSCHFYRRIESHCAKNKGKPCPYDDWKQASRNCFEYSPGRATKKERRLPLSQ